ncbi:hypothetical protein TTHERM_000576819 (macronuclear) [Tetrahymena thermophila SB210]|uniref:Uncharacterized protein n=1 Tax=Tetrahymena thermophila (strain SB210) TaxID=312017 RepID=W7XJP2_TETTS|nr:hypothetical protein TTHERM_000576819 [Tetrahymena thermophila SB210]EWS75741.1 hypothetical protein TTHERM_000576819 [Tetrahymena thermophila SB210]|eukprot:XP_012651663.1 hypothetical protein TTHERM_000576819 [Tetrahymena thermophila SB210]
MAQQCLQFILDKIGFRNEVNEVEEEIQQIDFCNLNQQQIEDLFKGRKQNIKLIKNLKVYSDSIIFFGHVQNESVEPAVFYINKMDSFEIQSLFQKQQREKEFENLNQDQHDIFTLRDSFFVPLPNQIDFFLQVNQYSLNLVNKKDDQINLIALLENNYQILEEKQKYIQNKSLNDSSSLQEKDIQQFLIYPEKLIKALSEQSKQFSSILQQKSFQIMSSSDYYKMNEFTNRFLYKIFETKNIQDSDPYIANRLQSQNAINDIIDSVFFESNVLYISIIDQKGIQAYKLIEQFNIKLLNFIKTIFTNIQALNFTKQNDQLAYQQLSSLTHIEINLRQKISDSDLLSLKDSLLHMQNLNTLLFDISYNKIYNNSLISTVQALSELSNLRNLYFLINNTQVNKQGIIQIAELLTKINQLEILIMDVRQCRIGIEGPKVLANCCRQLNMIKFFEVQFTNTFERLIFELELSLQDNKYQKCEIIRYYAAFMQTLQDIDIRLQSNYLDLDEIQLLFNYLLLIPQQKSLKLDLCSTQINDSGVILLQSFLNQMKELDILVLNLSYNQISFEGSLKFGKFFRQIQNLKRLEFFYQEPIKRLFFEISYFYEDNFGPKQRQLLFPKYLSIDEKSKQIELDLSDSLFLSMSDKVVQSMMNLLSQQSKIQGLIFSSLDREKHTLLFQILSQLKLLKYIKHLKIQRYSGVSQYFLPENNLRKKICYHALKMPRLVMLTVQA